LVLTVVVAVVVTKPCAKELVVVLDVLVLTVFQLPKIVPKYPALANARIGAARSTSRLISGPCLVSGILSPSGVREILPFQTYTRDSAQFLDLAAKG